MNVYAKIRTQQDQQIYTKLEKENLVYVTWESNRIGIKLDKLLNYLEIKDVDIPYFSSPYCPIAIKLTPEERELYDRFITQDILDQIKEFIIEGVNRKFVQPKIPISLEHTLEKDYFLLYLNRDTTLTNLMHQLVLLRLRPKEIILTGSLWAPLVLHKHIRYESTIDSIKKDILDMLYHLKWIKKGIILNAYDKHFGSLENPMTVYRWFASFADVTKKKYLIKSV